EKFPEFNIVLTAGGVEDPHGDPDFVGKTLLVDVGHKGKYVGVVGYYPDQADQPLRFELVDLDNKRFKNSPAMDEHMRYYQETLLGESYDQVVDELNIGPHPSGSTFVGAQ